MKSTITLLSSALLLLLTSATCFGQQQLWTIDPNHTQAGFQVRHLGVSNVRGAFSNVKGTVVWNEKDLSKSSVEAVIDATTINSGSGYRDKDLKGPDWFNIEKFPTLTFKSTSVSGDGQKLKVVGDLTIAGVTRKVSLDVDGPTTPQKGMQGGVVSGLSGTVTIKRSDFNFGSKYPGAVVSDEVKITIDAEIDQK